MKAFYYDHLEFPLPAHHRFPSEKYRLLRQMIMDRKTIPSADLIPAPAATEAQLLLGHAAAYIAQIREGTLPRRLERELGLPLSPELARRVTHTVGGTIAASRAALIDGVAASTGGGTHHAQFDRPQGYCVFNDAVIALRVLQQEGLIKNGVIIDCDVHQGNGSALITAGDPTIFTFSIHCTQNFPARKAESDLDIGLNAGIEDQIYLEALRAGLAAALDQAEADLVIYLAGADPFSGDRLGKLKLSKQGLARRDKIVLENCRRYNLPVTVTMAGGYGRDIQDTVEIYHETIRLAATFAANGRVSPTADG